MSEENQILKIAKYRDKKRKINISNISKEFSQDDGISINSSKKKIVQADFLKTKHIQGNKCAINKKMKNKKQRIMTQEKINILYNEVDDNKEREISDSYLSESWKNSSPSRSRSKSSSKSKEKVKKIIKIRHKKGKKLSNILKKKYNDNEMAYQANQS